MSSRVVVTGLGAAAPNGLGLDEYWDATIDGTSGIGRISRFDPAQYPSQLAGEITTFEPAEHLPGRLLPQTDWMTKLALVCADWALADAGVDPGALDPFDMGVVTASSSGGFEFGQNELRALWSKGGKYVSAYQSFAWFYAVNTGQISIRNGMKGSSGVLVSDQAGGLDAIAQAARQVRKGTQLVMSGGMDAAICPWGWVAQLAGGRMSTSTDPERAFLPFDPSAQGHVAGEGGALLVLEDAEHAAERGAATVYGEIIGYGATFDPAPHRVATGEVESGLGEAIRQALRDADITPDEVDVVFADAAGIPHLDRDEAVAIAKVFGPRGVPVTAPKVLVGRLNSGGAPLDVATALLALRNGVVPPTPGVAPAEDYDLDLVTEARPAAGMRTALVIARGHGGFNSTLLVRTAGN
ncbi:beta-ketoacyl synthase [Saccharomonospora sp. CUA-673]|uniref:ketosynthase chain-length factor n=1 Tax=Saccharomonospora sp. CUA-673 TaxID=1904969 RepID=UPI00095EF32C|nr:ketosynthase chain-length factor [Saccharomonospora sp. CUA-673]OLT48990.1 beta-ketoacyl synthase [Saccharomonospora sp. CUA-673]